MEITGRASGKLLLFGEHAAVHGYPAVGISLLEQLQVTLRTADSPDVDVSEWQVPALEDGEKDSDKAKLTALIEHLASIIPGLPPERKGIIEISSTIPRGLGFGSSAALCAALARALASLAAVSDNADGRGLEDHERKQDVWRWAHAGETLFHGTPSGIDTGLALHSGLYRLRPRPPALPSLEPIRSHPLSLVIGATPRHARAKELIAAIGEGMAVGNARVRKKLHMLGNIAEHATRVLAEKHSGKVAELGTVIRESHSLLSQLGLSTDELDFMLSRGVEAGAAGGKLSGAGGGGAFYLLYPDAYTARKAAALLRDAAVKAGIPTADTIRSLTVASELGHRQARQWFSQHLIRGDNSGSTSPIR